MLSFPITLGYRWIDKMNVSCFWPLLLLLLINSNLNLKSKALQIGNNNMYVLIVIKFLHQRKQRVSLSSVLMKILGARHKRRCSSLLMVGLPSCTLRRIETCVTPEQWPKTTTTLRLVRIPGKKHPEIVCTCLLVRCVWVSSFCASFYFNYKS